MPFRRKMDEIKTVILSLSVSLVIYGVIMLLTPVGSMSGIFKTAVGIALICTVISGVFNSDVKADFEMPRLGAAEVSDIGADLQAVKASEKALEDYLGKYLKESGVSGCDVSVNMDISESGDIFIVAADVRCASDSLNTADTALKKLGIPYNITETKK